MWEVLKCRLIPAQANKKEMFMDNFRQKASVGCCCPAQPVLSGHYAGGVHWIPDPVDHAVR